METNQETNDSTTQGNKRNLSDIERLFYAMQGTFGGRKQWYELDLQAQQVFIQSVNNIRGICSL